MYFRHSKINNWVCYMRNATGDLWLGCRNTKYHIHRSTNKSHIKGYLITKVVADILFPVTTTGILPYQTHVT